MRPLVHRMVCQAGWLLLANAPGLWGQSTAPEPQSAWHRWLAKPIRQQRLLDDMEAEQAWLRLGEGQISWTQERFADGKQSLRWNVRTRPTSIGIHHSSAPFGQAVAHRAFLLEDWRSFNRVSVQIYPQIHDQAQVPLLLRLRNRDPEGAAHDWVFLQPNKWNTVVWEIAHVTRNKVQALELIYYQQATRSGQAADLILDVDRLELQLVEPDHYQGWDVWPGRLSYSHVGYRADSLKQVVASDLSETEFRLVKSPGGEARNFPIQTKKTPHGTFQIMDFTSFRNPGRYVVEVGGRLTEPFVIGESIWHQTITPILKGFTRLRCGLEGQSEACHLDWQLRSGSESIAVYGGWHPSSQPPRNLETIAGAVRAMAEVAISCQAKDPILDRLIEEMTWGLDWLIKTHLNNGTRVQRPLLRIWSDSEMDTADDPPALLTSAPAQFYLAASAEASAARLLAKRDSRRARQCLQTAKLDWEAAQVHTDTWDLEVATAGTQAALDLFLATGEQRFANAAVELAKSVSFCQQRDWRELDSGLLGFFYATTNRSHLLDGTAICQRIQTPTAALAGLCQAFPNHARWMDWYATVALHSEFLRTTAKLNAPWDLVPTNLCREAAEKGAKNSLTLNERHYVRNFPNQGTGHTPNLLTRAKALASAAQLRRDPSLLRLAEEQMQWIVGRNPFAQSLISGLGHDFPPLFHPLVGQVEGAIADGIGGVSDQDQPFWPTSTAETEKQLSLIAAARWLSVLPELNGEAHVHGTFAHDESTSIEFTEVNTGLRYRAPRRGQSKKFQLLLPAGQYEAGQPDAKLVWTFMPGQVSKVDLAEPLAFSLSSQKVGDGEVQIVVRATGRGQHRFQLRAHNLEIQEVEKQVTFGVLGVNRLKWTARIKALDQPWLVVVIPDRDLSRRQELLGSIRPN